MKYLPGLASLAVVLASCANGSNASSQKKSEERPNIVIVMADDLGYSDLGCYGGEIETPNLDWLAKNGVRFNSFYNASRCCPTRASLLTGLYPHQAGIGRMTFDQGKPGYQGTLDSNTVTIAEVLKEVGYQTGMVGKWHISETIQRKEKKEELDWLAHKQNFGPFADTATYPVSRGFDKFYGTIWGVVDYFDPFSLVNGMEQVMEVPKDFYYTNAIGDSSAAYVKQFSENDAPFFMYVAHTAPHWPLQALPEDIAKYENTYKAGWRALREQRFERMKKLGLFEGYEISLSDFMFPDKEWETNADKAWDAHAMAVHAAMVHRMDANIGKLIDQLKETGELENTVIMFLSDNGASSEDPTNYGPGFDRAGSTRDGREVAFPKNKEVMPGPQTAHTGIGEIWANSVNAPFRYYKAKEHEGGITTPFIIHWPAGMQQKNAVNATPAHIVDLMNSCMELAGTQYPKEYKGKSITPSPGVSILPALEKDFNGTLHSEIFWEHFGAAALRQGDFKIVKLNNNAPWELYNLKTDRAETNDLAKQDPEKLKAMADRWQELAQTYKVFPKP